MFYFLLLFINFCSFIFYKNFFLISNICIVSFQIQLKFTFYQVVNFYIWWTNFISSFFCIYAFVTIQFCIEKETLFFIQIREKNMIFLETCSIYLNEKFLDIQTLYMNQISQQMFFRSMNILLSFEKIFCYLLNFLIFCA